MEWAKAGSHSCCPLANLTFFFPDKELQDLKQELNVDFHKVSVEELCARFHTDIASGLKTENAIENQKKYGPNQLTPPAKTPGSFLFRRINVYF